MKVFIVPIVEGKTEQGAALKELLERVWYKLLGHWQPLSVQPAVRGKRDLLVTPEASGELTERIRQANNDLQECLAESAEYRGLVLLLLDSEQVCPATLAPTLLAAASRQCPHIPNVACVLAVKEFENWLVAGANGFAGFKELKLPDPLVLPQDPEARKGSAWLAEQRQKVGRGLAYTKTRDAIDLVKRMDLVAARASSPSFDKLCRELEKLIPPPPPADPSPPAP